MKTYAPIVLFVYKRLEKTQKVIDSLKNNLECKDSDLIIFSDSEKNIKDRDEILAIRKYLKNINGFKNIKIIKRTENYGLMKSVIEGVSQVLNEYDKVIVLEDDIVVSKNFIKYMNESLEYYKKFENIISISAYNYNFNCMNSYSYDTYLTYRVNTWGWGTWSNKWVKVDLTRDIEKNILNDRLFIKKLKLSGDDLYRILKQNILNNNQSWSIRWIVYQIKNDLLTVYPVKSKVFNIGNDLSGTNASKSVMARLKNTSMYNSELDNSNNKEFNFATELDEKIQKKFKYINSNLNKIIFIIKDMLR